MSVDSKQKRGSTINVRMPFRRWAVEPTGTLNANRRASLLRLSSAISPQLIATFSRLCFVDETISTPQLLLESTSFPSLSGEIVARPELATESIVECS